MSINCSSLTSVWLLLKITQLASCAPGAAPIMPIPLLPSAAIRPATSVPCAQLRSRPNGWPFVLESLKLWFSASATRGARSG